VGAEFEVFRIERSGAVAIVWLDRPEKLNAMAPVFFRELPRVLEAAAESGAGAIVLTGAGRAFSAGGDIASFVALSDLAKCRRHLRSVFDAFWSVERAELPVIGAVNGIAYGGGTELVLACDIVLASDRARFAFKEATVGLMPGYGIVRGPEVIGRAWTRWLSFTGDEIDAAQAMEIGLAQRVVPHDRLLDEAVALAERIAANPPLAVRAAKSFVNADTGGRALADSIEATALLFTTDDHKQRVAAFLDPRAQRANQRATQ
jgi:enoyl-CoA hydratase/carnithine racemase